MYINFSSNNISYTDYFEMLNRLFDLINKSAIRNKASGVNRLK